MTNFGFPTDIFGPSGHTGPDPTPLDFCMESVIDYIRGMLGYPLVEVELDFHNYRLAIAEAFKTYNRYHPRFERTVISVSPSVQRYKLPYVGNGVVEVQPNRNGSFLLPGSSFSINLGDGVVSSVLPSLQGTYGIDEIYEAQIYGEMFRRTLSWDFQWTGEGGYLWLNNITPDICAVSVIYSEDHTYQTLPKPNRDWIERFALAKAKQMLGEVRGKFNFPGPAGQQMMERRAELIAEGKEEEAALRAEMSARAWPIPPSMDDVP